jgi:hypothetical protein
MEIGPALEFVHLNDLRKENSGLPSGSCRRLCVKECTVLDTILGIISRQCAKNLDPRMELDESVIFAYICILIAVFLAS